MVWFVLILAYLFEFANGWTDAPNSIATVVSTRALRPLHAVVIAAVLNLIGALTGTAVAETISEDIVDIRFITLETIAAVLLAATLWDWVPGISAFRCHGLDAWAQNAQKTMGIITFSAGIVMGAGPWLVAGA